MTAGRVMDRNGDPITELVRYRFGRRASCHVGELGGEPSFSGQANGLWLWQTAIGSIIVNAVVPTKSIMPPGLRFVADGR